MPIKALPFHIHCTSFGALQTECFECQSMPDSFNVSQCDQLGSNRLPASVILLLNFSITCPTRLISNFYVESFIVYPAMLIGRVSGKPNLTQIIALTIVLSTSRACISSGNGSNEASLEIQCQDDLCFSSVIPVVPEFVVTSIESSSFSPVVFAGPATLDSSPRIFELAMNLGQQISNCIFLHL